MKNFLFLKIDEIDREGQMSVGGNDTRHKKFILNPFLTLWGGGGGGSNFAPQAVFCYSSETVGTAETL